MSYLKPRKETEGIVARDDYPRWVLPKLTGLFGEGPPKRAGISQVEVYKSVIWSLKKASITTFRTNTSYDRKIQFFKHYMKMTRKFLFLAINSKYGPAAGI